MVRSLPPLTRNDGDSLQRHQYGGHKNHSHKCQITTTTNEYWTASSVQLSIEYIKNAPEESDGHNGVGVTVASSSTYNVPVLKIHRPHTNDIVLDINIQQLQLQKMDIFDTHNVEDNATN